MSSSEIQDIVRLGGGVSVDAALISTSDLQNIARLANNHSGLLIVRNATHKSSSDLKSIARHAPGKVIFEL